MHESQVNEAHADLVAGDCGMCERRGREYAHVCDRIELYDMCNQCDVSCQGIAHRLVRDEERVLLAR